MAWAKTLIRTSKPEPDDDVTWCPLCGIELWVTRGARVAELEYIELAVQAHLGTYHAFRYRLWRLLGKRTSAPLKWLLVGFGG